MLKQDINIPLLATVGAVSSILLVVVLLGVHAWYLWEVNAVSDSKWQGVVTNKRVVDLKDAQRMKLNAAPRWADREKGYVHIPIEAAMTEVVKSGGKLPE